MQNQELNVIKDIELLDPKHYYNEVLQNDTLTKYEVKKLSLSNMVHN